MIQFSDCVDIPLAPFSKPGFPDSAL